MTTYLNKAWYTKAFVSIQALNGGESQLQSRTTTLKVTGGGFDLESLDVFSGKLSKIGSRDTLKISFEGIPVSPEDFDWIGAGKTSSTVSTITSSTVTPYRITFLWTDYTGSITSAALQSISTSGVEAYRKSYAEAYCTTPPEISMDAGDVLKASFEFTLLYEDEFGVQNFRTDAKSTSSTLSALNAYTSSTTKW